jgi:hypothetical protein
MIRLITSVVFFWVWLFPHELQAQEGSCVLNVKGLIKNQPSVPSLANLTISTKSASYRCVLFWQQGSLCYTDIPCDTKQALLTISVPGFRRYSRNLAQLKPEKRTQRGPVIEIIDPAIRPTRGIPEIRTRSGIQRLVVGRVIAPAGLLAFTVNERPQEVDSKGLFRTQFSIVGSTTVRLVAIDKQGRRSEAEFMFVPERATAGNGSKAASAASTGPGFIPPLDFGKYYVIADIGTVELVPSEVPKGYCQVNGLIPSCNQRSIELRAPYYSRLLLGNTIDREMV